METKIDSTNSPYISPKDVFLHILAIVTLYASAVAFNTLIFQYINYWFTDAVRDAYFYQEGLTGAMRFAISVLIVVFPVYYGTSRMLRKMYEAEPGRKNLAIRKWLSYFTIFLAAGIAIGWLIALINTFLNGDFTTAFLLKALAIFFTTGSIFYYYRAIIRGDEYKESIRYFSYFVAAIVLAAVIAAFFIIGSPEERRLRKNDMDRISDLQNIQYQIGDYYRAKSTLPGELENLNDSFRGVNVPKDPVTGEVYKYNVIDADTFELCANFAAPWSPNADYPNKQNYDIAYPGGQYFGPYSENWEHGAGEECFERTIDPDYFKPETR